MRNINSVSIDWVGSSITEFDAETSPAVLPVNVVFTTENETAKALEAAEQLAGDIGTVKLIVAKTVPYTFDLEYPQVDVEFVERMASGLVNESIRGTTETSVQVCLCRSRERTLLKILPPNSLVLIGQKRRWWPTEERRLADALRQKGHQVLLID